MSCLNLDIPAVAQALDLDDLRHAVGMALRQLEQHVNLDSELGDLPEALDDIALIEERLGMRQDNAGVNVRAEDGARPPDAGDDTGDIGHPVWVCLVDDADAHADHTYDVVEALEDAAGTWAARPGGLSVLAENVREKTAGTHNLADGQLVFVTRALDENGAYVYVMSEYDEAAVEAIAETVAEAAADDVPRIVPAVAQSDYTFGGFGEEVSVKLCADFAGSTPTGSAVTALLPYGVANYPNVREDDVIGVIPNPDTTPTAPEYVAVSLHLDDPIGTVKIIAYNATIPAGWSEWATPTGSFIRGFVPAGATSGGSDTVQPGAHSNHALIAAHDHDVTEAQTLDVTTVDVDKNGDGYSENVVKTVAVNNGANPVTSTAAGGRAALSHSAHSVEDNRPAWVGVLFIIRDTS